MIKWLLVLFQIFSLKSNFSKFQNPGEFIQESIARFRPYLLYSVGCVVATVFLLIAITVFVIAAGLQIESQGGISFTGLVLSASIFFGISCICYLMSFLILLLQKQKALERARVKESQSNSVSSLTPILEEILKHVLAKVSEPRSPANETKPQDTP